MCNYLSLIVTKGGKALWLPRNPQDHEAIITKYKLNDRDLTNRTWVRVEINPADDKRPTRDRKDWTLKVDETDTLPAWWMKDPDKQEALAWGAWEDSVKLNIAIDEDRGEIRNQYLILIHSRVVARENSRVEAWDNSRVVARDNSSVVARDNSSVEARENSRVVARENSRVEAWDNSSVVAWDNSRVEAWDNSSVVAWENSRVKLYQKAKAKLQSPLATAIKDGKLYVKSLDNIIATEEAS